MLSVEWITCHLNVYNIKLVNLSRIYLVNRESPFLSVGRGSTDCKPSRSLDMKLTTWMLRFTDSENVTFPENKDPWLSFP